MPDRTSHTEKSSHESPLPEEPQQDEQGIPLPMVVGAHIATIAAAFGLMAIGLPPAFLVGAAFVLLIWFIFFWPKS